MFSVARAGTTHFKSCKKNKNKNKTTPKTSFKVTEDLTLGKLAYLQILQSIFTHF